MTNLPPLPLIDNHLFIDNSGWMEGLSTCPRALEYRTLRKRILSQEKPSLNFGSAIHLALELRYAAYANRAVDDQYYNNLGTIFSEFFAEHPTPDDDWRTLNWAMTIARKYNERYVVEEFSLLEYTQAINCPICVGKYEIAKCVFCSGTGQRLAMVELPFALELYKHTMRDGQIITVMYSGKIDLPIKLEDKLYVLDHKTTSMMGEQFPNEMRMSAQQRGYVWAFEQLTNQPLHGYFINGIRTKEVPLYVLKGKEFKGKEGKVSTAETWWNENFVRHKFPIERSDVVTWQDNTIDLLEEFFFNYERGVMPQKTTWCSGKYGKCAFYNVCTLAASDRLSLLNSGEYVDNLWSPLNDKNTK